MRIAVLADIHGNHVALEKCLTYIDKQNVDAYIFLGDYLGEMPYPQRTMKLLYDVKMRNQCYFISGNKETYWSSYLENGEMGWLDNHSVTGSLLYTYQRITKDDLTFFKDLNTTMQLSFEGLPELTLVHVPAYKELTGTDIFNLSVKKRDLEGNIILCGHRHIQGQIDYQGSTYINPGSVGVPLYCKGKTQFAILESVDLDWNVDYISLDYNVDQVIQELYEEKLDVHAPCWTRMSIQVLKGSKISHAYGIQRAVAITKEKYGECIWPNIPEECFEQAVEELEKQAKEYRKYG